jgi:uncharacterized protein
MVARILFILVLLAVSFAVLKYLRGKINNKSQERIKKDSQEMMVKCQYCGIHIPDHEAIKQGDKVFCSLEHARQLLK